MPSRYSIRYSKPRAKRGLPAWAVFEQLDEFYSRAVSDHQTEAEALAAKQKLEEQGK